MAFVIKLAIFLFLAFMDLEFTKRILSESGIDAELNPVVRQLAKWLGINWGVSLGVLIPTALVGAGGWYFPHVLSFAIGVRFCLFLFQLRQRYGK